MKQPPRMVKTTRELLIASSLRETLCLWGRRCVFVIGFSSVTFGGANTLCSPSPSPQENTANPLTDEKSFYLVTSTMTHAYKGPDSRFPIAFSIQQNDKLLKVDEKGEWIRVINGLDQTGWIKSNDLFPLPGLPESSLPIFPTAFTRTNRLDDEHWAFGVYNSTLHLEDFGNNTLFGIQANYHISEWLFIESSIATAQIHPLNDNTAAEQTTELTNHERRFAYFFAGIGSTVFPSQLSLSSKRRWNSAFSGSLNVGAVYLNQDNHLAYRASLGYHVFPTDWVSLGIKTNLIHFRHRIFNDVRSTTNPEIGLGIQLYF